VEGDDAAWGACFGEGLTYRGGARP
jgi:hypothetical protein